MAEFSDIVFKLAVLNELMYNQQKLPAFDLTAVERATGKSLSGGMGGAVPEDDGFGFIPEVKAYFEAYEIPGELLDGIEALEWEAGEPIQGDVAPSWDGEDELFDFTARSAQDVVLCSRSSGRPAICPRAIGS